MEKKFINDEFLNIKYKYFEEKIVRKIISIQQNKDEMKFNIKCILKY
jgi:hypothetical protein